MARKSSGAASVAMSNSGAGCGSGPQRAFILKWIAAGALLAAVAIGGWAFSGKLTSKTGSKATAGPDVSLAILPFRNGSGMLDSIGWIEPGRHIEHGRRPVRTLAHDLSRPPASSAVGLADLAWHDHRSHNDGTHCGVQQCRHGGLGTIREFGDQIRIDATVRDLKHQRTIPVKAEAPNEKALLPTIAQLAVSIQQNLSLSPMCCRNCDPNRFSHLPFLAGPAELQRRGAIDAPGESPRSRETF